LANEINARKVHDELNVFKGFFNNWLFLAIVIGTAGVQALIVEFGSEAFKVKGLTAKQWGICIVCFCCVLNGNGGA
jgi:hypothetical protein